MKKGLVVLLSAAFVLSCATMEDYENAIGDPDLPLVPEASSGDLTDFDESVFGLIDLDYPGLENVRYFYENGDAYSAGVELLKYYRTRSVIDPSLSGLVPPSVSSDAVSIADQATKEGEYRFKVSDFLDADGKG